MKRPVYERPAAPPPKPLARPVRLAQIGDEVRGTPKGVTAKPGKRAPLQLLAKLQVELGIFDAVLP